MGTSSHRSHGRTICLSNTTVPHQMAHLSNIDTIPYSAPPPVLTAGQTGVVIPMAIQLKTRLVTDIGQHVKYWHPPSAIATRLGLPVQVGSLLNYSGTIRNDLASTLLVDIEPDFDRPAFSWTSNLTPTGQRSSRGPSNLTPTGQRSSRGASNLTSDRLGLSRESSGADPRDAFYGDASIVRTDGRDIGSYGEVQALVDYIALQVVPLLKQYREEVRDVVSPYLKKEWVRLCRKRMTRRDFANWKQGRRWCAGYDLMV